MSQGLPQIDSIMSRISKHIKPNTTTENHYNRIYEAFWDLINSHEAEVKHLRNEIVKISIGREVK